MRPLLPRCRATVRSLAAVALSAALAACGGSDAPSGPPPVTSVTFATPADTLLVGQSQRLRVMLRDANGRTVSNAAVTWNSSNGFVASVDTLGVAAGRNVGETEITAVANGRFATLRLVVRPVPVASVAFEAPPATMIRGGTAQLRVVTRDSVGAALAGRTVTYSSSAPAVASVSASGLVTALEAGDAQIGAASEGRTATITVRVSPVPVALVEIIPSTLDLQAGRTVQLSTVQRDAQGQPLASRPVTYRSTNLAVVEVSAGGLVRALAPGMGAIVAEVEGKVATATVTVSTHPVTPPPPPPPTNPTPPPASPQPVSPPPLPSSLGDGSYSIRVSWAGMPDARAANVVDAVIARWGRVITGDLPDVAINMPVGACYTGQPAEQVAVDDLLIFVRVTNIDGVNGTLARAGPCYVRQGSGLPIVGVVELDAADLDRNASVVEAVLLHEFGHVLGIGTLWGRQGLLYGSAGDDPLFLGATAHDAYLSIGGSTLVPVENTGGPGTRLGHWREQTFRSELMTGWISAGHNPLSRMTIASLRDLGYRVDMNAADAYSLPSMAAVNARIAGGGKGVEVVDELILPRFVVDRDGMARRIGY